MSGLEGVKVTDQLVIVSRGARPYTATVTKVARVWLTTDSNGARFRIADGAGDAYFGGWAYTEAGYAACREAQELRRKLADWGWHPAGNAMTLDQFRRAAALLAEFEAEGTRP